MNATWMWRLRLGLVLAFTALLYWPGLTGSYLFDDYPNITDNADVHVSSTDWRDWRQAALASPSPDLRRPLAMLSFGANYYFTGLDPWPMKLTNLCIHLLNGALLFGALMCLLRLGNLSRPQPLTDPAIRWISLGLASAWLVAPINLSSVLYVVQRMEILAQTFVVAGLWLYLEGRRRMIAGETARGLAIAASGLIGGVALGVLCKESAALLPLYAFLIEAAILRFTAQSPAGRRTLWLMFGFLLFLPMIGATAWILPRALNPDAYLMRPFTVGQRLFTEIRVIADYLTWTVFPYPGSLSFYHDDIGLSDGWLSPPSTLGCAAMLCGIIAAAVALRNRLPLLALGVGWFFTAHLLTATIIPLELVFEHRNYFASIGVLLAVAAPMIEIHRQYRLIRLALPLLGLTLFSIMTELRAREWSNPVNFAYAEASAHPNSPRANYELGRTLTIVSGYRPDSKLIDPALHSFEAAAALPNAGAPPLAALIVVAGHAHRRASASWWAELSKRLADRPPSSEDIGALISLYECQHSGACAPETGLLLEAFLAALDHQHADPKLLAAYGSFAANQLGDYTLAANMLREALAQSPHGFGYSMELANILVLKGEPASALNVLDGLDTGTLSAPENAQLQDLRKTIQSRFPSRKGESGSS